MTTPSSASPDTNALLSKLQAEPNNWVLRKEAALGLYQEAKFLEAADTIWNAPEMPSVDVDVAFTVKIVSRARPNRAIRLVYEMLRRNEGKGEKNMAMAKAFHFIGLPMLASRFYGAAIENDAKYFDIGFESQSLWYDESGSLQQAWEKSDQDVKPPFVRELQIFAAESIDLSQLSEDVDGAALAAAGTTQISLQSPARPALSPVSPLANSGGVKPVISAVPVRPVPAASPVSPQLKPAQPQTPVVPPAPPTAPSTTAEEQEKSAEPRPMLPPME